MKESWGLAVKLKAHLTPFKCVVCPTSISNSSMQAKPFLYILMTKDSRANIWRQ